MLSKPFIKRWALPITVFITGAGVLVVEIVANRMLSPYFGSTIFTISSVISVVLAALSVGYYVGGRLADRLPTWVVFYRIVLVGGLSIFVLYWMQLLILPTLGSALPLTFGPLVSSVLLLFVPSFTLGMLSPFAIKLQQMGVKDQGIGSISGEIFFYSTLGSILGSLLAGYVLIPHVGVRASLIGSAAVITALGLFPLIWLGANKRFLRQLGLLVIAGVFLSFFISPEPRAVYSHHGVYEKIVIKDGTFDGRPARFLFQDRSASGAMYLDSNELVYDYTKYYALHELMVPEVQRALVIGGGAYSIPKALLHDLPNATVDVSEIEPSLVELSEKYFNLPKNEPRLRHFIEDGRRHLKDASQPYDLIFGDAYHSLYSVPTHLTTKEFFKTVYDQLSPEGLFVMNVIGSLDPAPPSVILSEIRTLREVFPNVYLFAVNSPQAQDSQNLVIAAHKSAAALEFGPDKIKDSKHEVIRSLPAHQVDLGKYDLGKYPLLTDDFAPVEYWTAQLLRRHGL
ncbi:MAG: fused MFS/spermidine synthase [Candidatus Saccharimonadales bacterium]